MLNNSALQSNQVNVTATGNTTLGFAPGNTAPVSFVTVSAGGAATIILPTIAVTATALGVGGNQTIRIMNLAAQSVAVAAASTDTILGASGTIAQNTQAFLTSSGSTTAWYRV